MTDPTARRAQAYLRAARRHERALQAVERRISLIAGVRLTAFLVGAASAFVAYYDRAPAIYLPIAGLALAVFLAAVWLHRKPYAAAPRLEALLRINREGAARIEGEWDQLPDDGARYLEGAEPQCAELQVFGKRGSLYQLLNRATLPAGRSRLATLLRDGAPPAELPERQAAARELAPLRAFRHRLEAEGRLVRVDDASLESFLRWAEEPVRHGWLRPLVWVGALLVPATWIQVVLSAGFDLTTAWRVTFLLQVVIYGVTTKALSDTYLLLIGDERHRPFVALRRMFALVERRKFESPLLARVQAGLGSGHERPSARMARIESILESLAVRHSALLYAVVSICLLWEVFQSARLEAWRASYGRKLRGDLASLADVEALVSVAGFAYDRPHYAWPEVAAGDEGPAFAAEGIGYPLFARESRVANDFTLPRGGQLVLITGSNMSGKSSFLRTVGSNVVLAQAGAPACARSLRMRHCRLATSIQVTDAPEAGLSRFYAEVKRIAGILHAVEAAERDPDEPPRLYLVDEMLSGTNSRERHLACQAIMHRLVQARRSYGLVTTHDLDLVQVADREGGDVPTYHFSDRFDGEALHFDYKLKEGIARTTNALHVLHLEGIEVPATPA